LTIGEAQKELVGKRIIGLIIKDDVIEMTVEDKKIEIFSSAGYFNPVEIMIDGEVVDK